LPGRSFEIEVPSKTKVCASHVNIIDSSGKPYKRFCLGFQPGREQSLKLILDIRNVSKETIKTEDSFAGINFWKSDRLHIPNFGASRNLLPNPSLEADMRYFCEGRLLCWGKWSGQKNETYEIDNTVAKFGKRSLRATVLNDYPEPPPLGTLTIPTVPGKKYTFSFYTKADAPKQYVRVECLSGEWNKFPAMSSAGISPGAEWTRYSGTFTAPNAAVSMVFRPENKSALPAAHIWFDGFQLEEGDSATEYTEKPLSSELLTASPQNFFNTDATAFNARLRISGPPNSEGSVSCELEDIFYNRPWKHRASFKTDASGEAVVPLPLNSAIGTGVYVLSADFELSNGFKDRDFFRIARMKFLNNTHKNKDICGAACPRPNSNLAAKLNRHREIGIGSTRGRGKNKVEFDLLEANRISMAPVSLLYKEPVFKVKGIKETEVETFHKIKELPPDIDKEIEESSYEMARICPWLKRWELHSEMEATQLIRNNKFKDLMRVERAAANGVRRASPDNKFYLGGSGNMSIGHGIRFMDEYLKTIRELDPSFKFDGVTIHPYRKTPEDPDLDSDTVKFFEVLDEHGYKATKSYWEEGIYYSPWDIPEWGLTPYQGCSMDHWSAGTPSYHMGWGERISAAYTARSWLVAFKYMDRIVDFIDNADIRSIDYNMTPMVYQKIPNTLGNLLGEAVFKRDIRFAPGSRVYVFEDGAKRPVAALWSYFPAVDHGVEPSPAAKVKFGDLRPEFIDLMENHLPAPPDEKGVSSIPVTPFPLFIRAKAGEMDKLCEALNSAKLAGAGEPPLALDMKLKSRDAASLIFENRITRPFQGTVVAGAAKDSIEKSLALAENASESIDLPLPRPIAFNAVDNVAIPVEIRESGGEDIKKDFTIRSFAAAKRKAALGEDGLIADWKDIPAIKLTNKYATKLKHGQGSNMIYAGDSMKNARYPEAGLKMAWDKNFLYVYVQVADEKPVFPKSDVPPPAIHQYESLQLYIDTLGDNANRKSKAIFDFNDYNYDVSMNADTGKAIVYRRAAPEQQIAGGLYAPKPNMLEPDVKAKVTLTSDGCVYNMAFPLRLIAPLRLEKNYFFRFGIKVCGASGSLVNTETPGSSPYFNPEQWPGVILSDDSEP
jgi:hypothetical protein